MNAPASLLAAIHEDIRLDEYDAAWPALYEAERRRLHALMPGTFLDIQHIGSTAVPAMVAKPIIDILAGVGSMDIARSMASALCSHGYTTSAAFNAALSDRQWFMRCSNGRRTHHLHVVVHGSTAWVDRLRFRDALRTNPALAAQYTRLKTQLAQAHAHDREAYTDAKSDFVHAVCRGS